jgi:RNA polymerase sigma-70 factor, ECF subfamily
VHEAYSRLVNQKEVDWKNRAQFLGIAAEVMRRILTHHARDRAAAKRGGKAQRVSLSLAEQSTQPNIDLIALDDALAELAKFDERKSRIVELKFFGGMTIEEIGEVLQISEGTVERDWNLARAWLYRAISGSSKA